MFCFVCKRPILKGQAYKTVPKDEKHKEERNYHSATCGVGSKAWAEMSKSGISKKLAEAKEKKQKEKSAKKVSKPKTVKTKKQATKAAIKKPSSKKPLTEKKSCDGYREGTQIHYILSCLKTGMDSLQMVKGLTKTFPDRKGDPNFYVHWYISKLRRDGHKIDKKEDGKYFLAARQ
jgi:hypothetical protein